MVPCDFSELRDGAGSPGNQENWSSYTRVPEKRDLDIKRALKA